LPAGYRLDEARLGDVFAIHRLEHAAFPLDAYGPMSVALVLLWPGNVNLKATDENGQLAGYVAGSPRPLLGRAWIVTLAVASAHRRRGLGSALLAACEQRLRPRTVWLTVRAGNAAAIALYEQAGYRRVRVIPRYYRGGADGIVMEKVRPDRTGLP
jgi:ribosomal-protein-alanine N-acetyltransferase